MSNLKLKLITIITVDHHLSEGGSNRGERYLNRESRHMRTKETQKIQQTPGPRINREEEGKETETVTTKGKDTR